MEELLLQPAPGLDSVVNARVNLFVDARHEGEAVRRHFQEVVFQLLDGFRVGDRGPAVEIGVVERPLEDVGERQKRETHGVAGDRHDLEARLDVRDEVVVRQHRAL